MLHCLTCGCDVGEVITQRSCRNPPAKENTSSLPRKLMSESVMILPLGVPLPLLLLLLVVVRSASRQNIICWLHAALLLC